MYKSILVVKALSDQHCHNKANTWLVLVDINIAPKALLLNFANPIIAQGAAHANLTLIDRFKVDITSVIQSGYILKLIPEIGCIEVLNDKSK